MKKSNIRYKIFEDHRQPMAPVEEGILNQYKLRSSKGSGTKGKPGIWKSIVGDLTYYIVCNHRSFRHAMDIHQVPKLVKRINI